jgi:hypothetical protein
MSFSFNPHQGLVLVNVEVMGPTGSAILRLALDSGATTTAVNVALLVALGNDPALAPVRVQVTTASGIEYVPRLPLRRLTALGHDRFDFPVLCHTLPPSAAFDGVLGLDFLRGHVLMLDFRSGQGILT